MSGKSIWSEGFVIQVGSNDEPVDGAKNPSRLGAHISAKIRQLQELHESQTPASTPYRSRSKTLPSQKCRQEVSPSQRKERVRTISASSPTESKEFNYNAEVPWRKARQKTKQNGENENSDITDSTSYNVNAPWRKPRPAKKTKIRDADSSVENADENSLPNNTQNIEINNQYSNEEINANTAPSLPEVEKPVVIAEIKPNIIQHGSNLTTTQMFALGGKLESKREEPAWSWSGEGPRRSSIMEEIPEKEVRRGSTHQESIHLHTIATPQKTLELRLTVTELTPQNEEKEGDGEPQPPSPSLLRRSSLAAFLSGLRRRGSRRGSDIVAASPPRHPPAFPRRASLLSSEGLAVLSLKLDALLVNAEFLEAQAEAATDETWAHIDAEVARTNAALADIAMLEHPELVERCVKASRILGRCVVALEELAPAIATHEPGWDTEGRRGSRASIVSAAEVRNVALRVLALDRQEEKRRESLT